MDRFPEVQVAYKAPVPPVTIAEIRTALGYDDPWHRACYGCGKTAVTHSAYVCTCLAVLCNTTACVAAHVARTPACAHAAPRRRDALMDEAHANARHIILSAGESADAYSSPHAFTHEECGILYSGKVSRIAKLLGIEHAYLEPLSRGGDDMLASALATIANENPLAERVAMAAELIRMDRLRQSQF
jgi:hypothetical protein